MRSHLNSAASQQSDSQVCRRGRSGRIDCLRVFKPCTLSQTTMNQASRSVPQARIIVPGSDGDDCNSFYVDNGGWSGDGRSALYDLLGLTEPEMAVAV
jgi:hypothetical protein